MKSLSRKNAVATMVLDQDAMEVAAGGAGHVVAGAVVVALAAGFETDTNGDGVSGDWSWSGTRMMNNIENALQTVAGAFTG